MKWNAYWREAQQMILVLCVSAFLIPGCGDPFNDKPFSKEAWAATSGQGRAPMADDVVRNRVLPGMSSGQVADLLGEPDDTWLKRTGQRVKGEKTLVYYIGSWSFEGMDDAFVCVHVDESGKVIEAEIYGY